MRTRFARLCAGAAGLLLATAATADNSTQIPGYIIHHNAFTTDVLAPEVANTYNIARSSKRAMLNVSVLRDANGMSGEAVPAKVTATATNLMGQKREVPMREVREGKAIYYIGDFLVAHREVLNLDLNVTPQGDTRTHSARLTQEFFTK